MFYGLNNFFKKILPKRLFYRSLIIVVTPIILLQIIITTVFFDSLWIKANKGMTRSLVSEAKDARISVTLSGLLITDASISDINYYHSVSDQIIYVIGIAQDKEELKRVLLHSRTIKGVKKVISHVFFIKIPIFLIKISHPSMCP